MRRVLGIVLSAVVAGTGVSTTVTVTEAGCTFNVGRCTGGNCWVNVGTCADGGNCTVTVGRCDAGESDLVAL